MSINTKILLGLAVAFYVGLMGVAFLAWWPLLSYSWNHWFGG